jgi:hypothetical protein
MRTKLNTFSEFSNTLFPHELDYLLTVQNFSKKSNLKILQQIRRNLQTHQSTTTFDTSLDKRTYSYIKNWITETLAKIDVDSYFEWLISVEKKVMTDSVSPEDEHGILENLKQINPTHYYFLRFYELLQHYRDYLLVRNRTKYYRVVSEFLDAHKETFFERTSINQRLNLATIQIIQKEEFVDEQFAGSEDFFRSLYFNEQLDGYTRYRAVVRLTIYFYNTRQFDKLLLVYQHLDEQFKTPLFYSKRILANYYANRAMMHSKLNELTLASKYGYLSIQNKNSDYLFYLINLCGVLLKQGKKTEALELMNASIPELKKTNSYYYKIGFVAFYIKTLMVNQQFEKAVNYASGFFDAYKKEIFEHRWHLFFTAYLQALIRVEKYAKVLSLCRRYKLVTKEKIHIGKAVYLPVIQWYSHLAEYMEGVITKEKLIASIVKSSQNLMENKYRSRKIMELLDELSFNLPSEIKTIKEIINQFPLNIEQIDAKTI